MKDIVELTMAQFLIVYVLLVIVLIIFKKTKIEQSRKLIVSSLMMTVQLVLAGFLLTYIFENPHPAFTVLYLLAMIVFANARILLKYPKLNGRFRLAIVVSLTLSGLSVLFLFVGIIVGVSLFEAQYVIPLGGMIIGNSMTGITLGLGTFFESLSAQYNRTQTLLNLGVDPKRILLPHVNQSVETALLPTINSMMGMGIIFLPGMMTGQILSGTLPTTAIMYQIAIMIAICATVCFAVFFALTFGYRTLYNKRKQIYSLTSNGQIE